VTVLTLADGRRLGELIRHQGLLAQLDDILASLRSRAG
jgi:hypothetical protein